MKFTKSYTEYWQKTVRQSVDGLKIAGPEEAEILLKSLSVQPAETVLDVGCSFGRMYETVKHLGEKIIGLDPDPFALEIAAKKHYSVLKVGTAESTTLTQDCVNLIFCWATFDVVNQLSSILEFNRVLQIGGEALITGKNWNYPEEDVLGLTAEVNAFKKGFPNHFTDLSKLIPMLPALGFEVMNLMLFHKRGDMGNTKFSICDPLEFENARSYEFLIHLKKIAQPDRGERISQFSSKYSKVAADLSKASGYKSPEEFLNSERPQVE